MKLSLAPAFIQVALVPVLMTWTKIGLFKSTMVAFTVAMLFAACVTIVPRLRQSSASREGQRPVHVRDRVKTKRDTAQ
jgi:hypothetical protein